MKKKVNILIIIGVIYLVLEVLFTLYGCQFMIFCKITENIPKCGCALSEFLLEVLVLSVPALILFLGVILNKIRKKKNKK